MTVEVCKHRYGKKMTYTEQTDGVSFGTSYLPIRDLLGEHNLKGGIFVSLDDLRRDYMSKVIEDEKTIWVDQYSSIYPSYFERIIKKLHLRRGNNKTISRDFWEEHYYEYLMPYFIQVTGRKPVAMSYAYGNDTYKDYQTQYLGARNSGVDGNTNYGRGCGNHPETFQPDCYKSRKSTQRWYDDTMTLIKRNSLTGGGNSLTNR